MTILVTGGAGFIGSNIVDELLNNNHNVIVIDNLSTGKKENINSKVEFFELDIRSKKISKVFKSHDIDFVFHLAAQIDVNQSIENPCFDADNNINGSINILKNCRANNIKKVIYSSSAAVYGIPNYLPIDENHFVSPISPYGISKHTPEHYLMIYNKLYGLNYTILRYSNVYGPRQTTSGEGGVISIFIDRMLSNKNPVIFGDGEQTRDFIYVEDVVQANISALNKGKNEILNISNSTKTSVNEIVTIINNKLDRNIKPVYKDKRSGDILHSVLDNKKAKKKLAWSPNYNINMGIEKALDYIKF